jgi:hypothetical protein
MYVISDIYVLIKNMIPIDVIPKNINYYSQQYTRSMLAYLKSSLIL